VNASTGVITTITGNGLFLFAGDNGVATSASLNNSESVSTDASGNICISDFPTIGCAGLALFRELLRPWQAMEQPEQVAMGAPLRQPL
jgi:hypothetical protein